MRIPSCDYCGILIHGNSIRAGGVYLHVVCYDKKRIAQLEEEVVSLRRQEEEKAVTGRRAAFLVTPCCGGGWSDKDDQKGPIYWNPYNRLVQCHRCGQVFEEVKAPAGKVD